MKKILSIAALSLCIFLLSGCQCEHEWVEADCDTPKTCSKCEITEGTSLSHRWRDADCVTAKTCAECGTTEGEPLGHDPGSWIIKKDKINDTQHKERYCERCDELLEKSEEEPIKHTPGYWDVKTDILTARQYKERYCIRCNKLLEKTEEDIDSFVNLSEFIFSPSDFLIRLRSFAEQTLTEFRYEIKTVPGSESMNVLLYFEEAEGKNYSISFCKKTGEVLTRKDLYTKGVWYAALACGFHIDSASEIDEYVITLNSDLLKAFYMACDPIFSEEDFQKQELRHLTSYLNWIEFDEYVGYSEMNKLLYEFFFGGISEDKGYYYIQQVGVYPVNFMK